MYVGVGQIPAGQAIGEEGSGVAMVIISVRDTVLARCLDAYPEFQHLEN